MKKTASKSNGISKASLLFLYRKFWALYLYSPRARRDFRRLALSKPKRPRFKKLIGLFFKSIEEFDQIQTARLKSFYSHSKAAQATAVLLVVASLFVVGQLLYPADRALPLARLQTNGYVGFSQREKVLTILQDFDRRIVSVHTHNKDLTTSYVDLGIRINIDNTFAEISNYSLSQRLIPFSILFAGNKTFQIDRSLDQSQLELFVKDVVAERDKVPVDAEIYQKGTEVTVVPAQEGFKYEKDELESQLLRSDLSDQSKIVFAPTVLYPRTTTYVLNDRATSLQARLNTPLTITAEDKSTTIKPEILASWVQISPRPEKGDVDISFNKIKIKEHLDVFAQSFNRAPLPDEITLLNGLPAGRTPGKNGRTLQLDKTVDRIMALSLADTPNIQADVKHTPPGEIINRRYSRDNTGLQALLNYWTQNNRGEYSIVVRDLNGRINANINPNQHFSAVGIYRLYLAGMIYSKISAGSLSGSTKTSTGNSVKLCLDKMIYESHAACSDALGDIAGWGASDSFLRAQGFGNTTLVKGASITTASDAADWIEKLYSRSITTDSQAGTLLSIMSRQINRSGIPAGLPGLRVDNKTGSYGRINHDVGLVYHPKGKYIVAILSQGSSLDRLADLSGEIEKVFDQ